MFVFFRLLVIFARSLCGCPGQCRIEQMLHRVEQKSCDEMVKTDPFELPYECYTTGPSALLQEPQVQEKELEKLYKWLDIEHIVGGIQPHML